MHLRQSGLADFHAKRVFEDPFVFWSRSSELLFSAIGCPAAGEGKGARIGKFTIGAKPLA
jgi:hypothetical protein